MEAPNMEQTPVAIRAKSPIWRVSFLVLKEGISFLIYSVKVHIIVIHAVLL